VVFVVDDPVAWLVGLVADAGRKKLTTLVLGSDQKRALRKALEAAVEATATELAPPGREQTGEVAMVVGEVFCDPPEVVLAEVAPACSLAPGSRVSLAHQRRITGGARASRLWLIYDLSPSLEHNSGPTVSTAVPTPIALLLA